LNDKNKTKLIVMKKIFHNWQRFFRW